MRNTPIEAKHVDSALQQAGIEEIGKGSIRDLVKVVNIAEKESGKKFIRMEMGVPGLMPAEIGTNAEIEALKRGVASKYPMIEGIPEIKREGARFAKLFLDIDDVTEENCVPSVGSMQGGLATFLTVCRRDEKKDTLLFIDPGFPVQKMQMRTFGLKHESFDVYAYRGEKLREKLESYFVQGNISSVLYSNPNNPSWICFTDNELKIIGELANKYDVTIIEDLAYFGMDFREDYSQPGKAPYQPSVTKYTKNYVLLVSSSKAFSYAGQRIGLVIISPELFNRKYEGLKRFYSSDKFGYCFIYGSLYPISSGVAHSAQFGFAAMLKAFNDGQHNFLEDVKVYGERAGRMKKLFVENGFEIVYDKDEDKPLADGFYFTFAYPGIEGYQLVKELLYYGISGISLFHTGSERLEGLRACTSQISDEQFTDLEERLKAFKRDH